MTIDDDGAFVPHASSPTDHVLTELQLHGYRPFQDEPDPRPLPETGKLIAGCRTSAKSRELVGTEKALLAGAHQANPGGNTTLCVVATNAKLTKVGATRLAKMAQAGVLRALSPGHTMVDGDIVIALSTGTVEEEMNVLGVAAAEAVAQAILRGVKTAKTLGGVPGLG